MSEDSIIPRGGHSDVGRTIIRGSGQLILGRIGRTLVTISGMVVLARILTPGDFGILALATIPTILSLVLLEAVIDYPIIRDDSLTRAGLRRLIWAGLLLNMVLVAALLLGARPIETMLGIPSLSLAFAAVAPVMLSQVFFVAGIGLLRRQHRFAAASMLSLFTVVLYMGLAVGLALAGFNLTSVIAALIISNVVTAAILIVLTGLPLAPPARFAGIVGQLQIGSYGVLSRLLNWGWTNIDTLAVSYYLGTFNTGIYSRAYNISVQAKEPFLAIDQTMRQAFASSKNRGNGEVSSDMIMALRIVTILSASVAAAIILLREWVVAILLGDQWTTVALPLAVLAAGLPARVARLYFDGIAVVVGDVRGMALRHGLLLVTIAIALALFAREGLAAVALCTIVPLYLSLLVAMGRAEREIAGPIWRFHVAMLPGLLFGMALVTVGELVLRPALADAPMQLVAAHIAMLIAAVALLAIVLPASWLGEPLTNARRKLVIRLNPFRRKAAPTDHVDATGSRPS